jgi:type IV secretory pathway TraG/TraD family ATPase VirD4
LSDVIQTMTMTSDLDIKKLRHERFSFYLSVPSRKSHLKPIAALIFNFLLDLALEESFEYPPALLLDEFTNYGAIPAIDEALSLIRKRNLAVVLGYQAHSQLAKVYGRVTSDNIIGNIGTCVFFRPALPAQSDQLSEALGQRTIVELSTDDQGHTHTREIGRPLMSAREIQTLPPEEVIIMTKSTNPIKTTRFDYRSCPPPEGFDMPELVEHKLLRVEKLNDADLETKAAKARAKAEREMDFDQIKSGLEDVIESAGGKFMAPDLKQSNTPPAGSKKTARSLQDDNWDIPG